MGVYYKKSINYYRQNTSQRDRDVITRENYLFLKSIGLKPRSNVSQYIRSGRIR